MNPIVLAGLHGLVAGFAVGPEIDARGRRVKPKGRAYAELGAPIVEETLYRALPLMGFGSALPKGATALAFAADHVRGEWAEHSAGSAALRFGDVFLGGLLYESAFRRFGWLGAIGAHMAHNIFVGVGRTLR